LKLVIERGLPGETYCIGGRNECRNIDIVHMICDTLDERLGRLPIGSRRGLVTYVKDRPGHDERYAIDPTRIASQLGWKPGYRLDTGLKSTIDWYVDNEWWWGPLVSRASSLDRIGLDIACQPSGN
jgi:dTDP-glucose 4,6-dehydratase